VGGPEADDDPDESYRTASANNVPDAPAPAAAGVSYGRELAERSYGVAITDKPTGKPKVIYSVRLGTVSAGERLLLRAEVTLSRCNAKDIAGLSGDAKVTPCNSSKLRKSPYRYAPRFQAAFVLADGADQPAGQRLSPWLDRKCTESEHHCALALPEAKATPDPAAGRYLNLVVAADADGAGARSFDVMEVEQGHGGLHVTRLGPSAPGPASTKDTKELRAGGKLRVDQPKEDGGNPIRHLLYRLRLDGVQPGDVLGADARARVRVFMTSGCDPLVTGELILTKSESGTDTQGADDGRLTARNGQNAADHSSQGTAYRKSGAIQIKQGSPSTMYLKHVAMAARSCANPHRDQWALDPDGGSLAVTIHRY
jgi:hypothetical protein